MSHYCHSFISELWHDISCISMQKKYVLFFHVWFQMHVGHAITWYGVNSYGLGRVWFDWYLLEIELSPESLFIYNGWHPTELFLGNLLIVQLLSFDQVLWSPITFLPFDLVGMGNFQFKRISKWWGLIMFWYNQNIREDQFFSSMIIWWVNTRKTILYC